MRVFVKVKARAKQEAVQKMDETHFKVSVKEPPVDGKANFAVIEALSDYIGKKKSQVVLISGKTSNQKVFEIL